MAASSDFEDFGAGSGDFHGPVFFAAGVATARGEDAGIDLGSDGVGFAAALRSRIDGALVAATARPCSGKHCSDCGLKVVSVLGQSCFGY
jgi:hypothetical protein